MRTLVQNRRRAHLAQLQQVCVALLGLRMFSQHEHLLLTAVSFCMSRNERARFRPSCFARAAGLQGMSLLLGTMSPHTCERPSDPRGVHWYWEPTVLSAVPGSGRRILTGRCFHVRHCMLDMLSDPCNYPDRQLLSCEALHARHVV